MKRKKVSIIVPFHYMKDWQFFLERCMKSIEIQHFKDYEVLLLKGGNASQTQNQLMRSATGELIKILHADDYFTDPFSLERIVAEFGEFDYWMASGCLHQGTMGPVDRPHKAVYTQDIHTGNNGLGGPSVITLRNELGVFFDESLHWMYDVDLYKRLHDKYGPPKIINDYSVVIGLHSDQSTNQIPDITKLSEVQTMKKRYE
jgi:hypothetical protein